MVDAQSFTVNQLIKLAQMNIDDFDTYVTKKGYKFSETSVHDTYQIHSYRLPKIERDKPISIDKYILNPKRKNVVNFTTYSTTEYLNFKNALKELGYKFINKEDNKELGGTYLLYKKGNIQVTLSSSLIQTSFGQKATAYEIGIEQFL